MEEAGIMQRVSPERSSLAVATTGAPKLLDRVRQTIRAKHAANAMVAANYVPDRGESSRVNIRGHKDMRSECYKSDCRVWTRGV